jgi:hypothetical protein
MQAPRSLLVSLAIGCSLAASSCPAGPWPDRPALATAESAPSFEQPPPEQPRPAALIATSSASAPVPAAQSALGSIEPAASPDEIDGQPDLPPPTAAADPGPWAVAIVKEAWVFSKPAWRASKMGYLRAGARVRREPRPSGYAGCDKGWYRIAPRGYVCAGHAVTLEAEHPVLEAAARRPRRDEGLPYLYVLSRSPPPPLYLKLPSEDEQRLVEPDLRPGKRPVRPVQIPPEALGPVPAALLYGRPVPSLGGPPHSRDAVCSGRPVARSGFALLEAFDWTDRVFGLTTDMEVIPLDRARVVATSRLRGVAIGPDDGLPAAFVRSRHARRYRLDPARRALSDAGPVAFREGVLLTGKQARVAGELVHEARDGTWVKERDNLVLVAPMREAPGWAAAGRKWIDVSILRQTLVAYEGTRPVYATLVSTGADGLGDPKETHSTVQGVFVVHTKHVSATMDGDDVGDEFDLRDVPYVQYFSEGYALHGAYWHDEFGTPRSHGCINLSPLDASWLFAWTDPVVPPDWHGSLRPRGGTIVYTHP